MKTVISSVTILLVLAAAVLVSSSAYTIQEWEQAIITEFGKPVGGPIQEAGLHWKKPFIQTVHRFEKRILEYDGNATEIPTRDKKFIFIDTFARWRIVDPLRFFQSVRDSRTAKTRLDDIIDSETRDAISSYPLIEVVRTTNRELLQDLELEEIQAAEGLPDPIQGAAEPGTAPVERAAKPPTGHSDFGDSENRIEKGRHEITREILASAAKKIDKFGIELLDVQIKSVNYVVRVQERVYERMVSEREQIAEKYRADGKKRSAEIQGTIEKEKNRILSDAYRQAETIKGEAEAEAANIYAEAYGKDPEFYEFWKTLQIYRDNIGENVSLVISADSDLFRYLRGAGAGVEIPGGAGR